MIVVEYKSVCFDEKVQIWMYDVDVLYPHPVPMFLFWKVTS